MIISDYFKFVYIDVPRTASTTLDKVFLKYKGYYHKPDDKRIKHCLVIPDYAKDYIRIVSVRNPYNRFESLFHYAKNNLKWVKAVTTPEEFIDIILNNQNKLLYWSLSKYIDTVTNRADYIVHTEYILEDLLSIPFINNPKIVEANKSIRLKDIVFSDSLLSKFNLWAEEDFNRFYPYARMVE